MFENRNGHWKPYKPTLGRSKKHRNQSRWVHRNILVEERRRQALVMPLHLRVFDSYRMA